jgi:hypothetical protein
MRNDIDNVAMSADEASERLVDIQTWRSQSTALTGPTWDDAPMILTW